MFSEKPTCPILKFTYHSKRFGGLKGPRNRSYKKEKKENVRNVLREARSPPAQTQNPLTISAHSKRSRGLKGPRNRSYKKEKKENVRNVLREAHLPKPKIHLPFQPIPRDPEVQRSKKPFLQKRKQKNISNVLSQKKKPQTRNLPLRR